MPLIRPAAPSDGPLLLRFLHELPEYERQPHAVVVNEETLIRDGFGVEPKFRGWIAEWDRQAIGYALFLGFDAGWKAPGIFLEDLFVREAFRGRGIGRALRCEDARMARREGCYAFAGEVLGWNEPAIQFYKSLGGKCFDDWRQVLLQADALKRLEEG